MYGEGDSSPPFKGLSKNTILDHDNAMLFIRIFSCVVWFGLTTPSLTFAELVAEEHLDDQWVVSYITENSVHATVNGQVTHGDRLHVRLVKGHCDQGNLLTFVYTLTQHPKIETLEGRYVTTQFNGSEVIVKVLYTSPFLMGHRATVDIGWASIGALKDILSQENPLVIEYLDSNDLKITDYFEITGNRWSNDGVSAALDRAVDRCKNL